MTLFEILFSLRTVVLGLALANIVLSLHRLALIGRAVRWAPEPLLLAANIFLVVIGLWLGQWESRGVNEMLVGEAITSISVMMAVYFGAASCLPDPDMANGDNLDLRDFYYRTRRLAYGALIVGLVIQNIGAYFFRDDFRLADALVFGIGFPLIYGALMWFQRRWLHISVLSGLLIVWGGPLLFFKLTS